MEYAELIRVKDRAWNDLSKLPGVHAVGVGMKTVAGVRSDEPCIVVFVNEKKDRASLKQDDVVPARIEDAVTDVVEVQAPRLMRGTPVLDAVFTPSPTIGGGGTISFTTTTPPADNIPAGYMVVLCSSVTPAGKPTQRSAFQWPTGNQTLALFISNALSLTVPSGFSLSNPANTSIITVRPDPNTTILVDCYVLQLDRLPYRLEFLRGGIGIYGTEPGTLGCLATTAPTVKQPQGGVVGITCRHVVTTQKYLTSRVFGAVSSNFTTISVGQTPPASNPIPANSLLFIGFYKGNNLIASSFYQTATGDKPADIAKGIVDAITSASIGGVTAKQGLDPTVVEITGGNVGGTEVECIAIGPPREDPKAHLKIDVQEMNKTPGSLTTLLSFSGTISKKYRYGVTVSVNRNDFIPTFSIFVDLFGKTIDEAVAAISSAIMKVDASLRGPVTTLPPSGGTTITIRNAQSVECFISRDTRVGQPEDNFSWPCSHEIGHVGDMGRSVDAALIPLDAGTKYKTVIEGIGVVDGLVGPGLFKQGLQVQKRGSSSGLTTGVVQIFATTGISGKYTYRNAFVVESTSLNPQQGTVKPFIVGGDSGSVVVTAGPGPVQVVGLLFASFAATSALAIPMQQVVDSFPDAKLSFALAPGQAPDRNSDGSSCGRSFFRRRAPINN